MKNILRARSAKIASMIASPALKAGAAIAALSFLFCLPTHAQGVPGGARNSGPETRLNLGGFGDNSNKAPQGPAQRVLQGVVQDKDGTPIKGAIVYLKDDRTSAIKSMTADAKGSYRFVQLSRTTEYKLWAQDKDKKSSEKAVSSFETKDEITRNLKIE